MNRSQAIIVVSALIIISLILWNGLPIGFPWVFNLVMLYAKVCGVIALAIAAYILASGKKKLSGKDGPPPGAIDDEV